MRELFFILLVSCTGFVNTAHQDKLHEYLKKCNWDGCSVADISFSPTNSSSARFLSYEIGCGSLEVIHPRQTYLDRFKARCHENRFMDTDTMSFVCADPLQHRPTMQYDRVIAIGTLDEQGEQETYAKALLHISSYLKPGGIAIVMHTFASPIRGSIQSAKEGWGLTNSASKNYLDEEAIRREVGDAELKLTEAVFTTEEVEFEDKSDFFRRNNHKTVNDVPESWQMRFWQDVFKDAVEKKQITKRGLFWVMENKVVRMILEKNSDTPIKNTNRKSTLQLLVKGLKGRHCF